MHIFPPHFKGKRPSDGLAAASADAAAAAAERQRELCAFTSTQYTHTSNERC